MVYTLIFSFAIVTLSSAILYFLLFFYKQEKFMKLWGFSWVAYSFGLLLLALFFATSSQLFLGLRKSVDMISLLLLLCGSYSFMHIKTPTYWYRFAIYMLLLSFLCILYKFQLLSLYLPISIFQLIITATITYNICVKWPVRKWHRIFTANMFLIWGFSKSLLSIFEIFLASSINIYIVEILLSNAVNMYILIVYIIYTQNKYNLEKNLYRSVVNNAVDAMFYYKIKPYRAFEFISPAIKVLTGYPPAKFYNDPNFLSNIMHYNDLSNFEDILNAPQNAESPYTLKLLHKDGTSFWGELSFTLNCDETGQPFAIQGTLRDVTRVKTAETEHINMTTGRNLLLSYISHELRTPLTSIAGFLTAINDGTLEDEEEKNEAMEIITAKTLTLKKLIDDLDQLSKMETHQFTFDYITYNLKDLTEMLLTECLSELRISDFEVEISCDYNVLSKYWIVADKDRINQVFSNLLNNAIKYSPHKKYLGLKFEIDSAKENYVVSVEDHGIGIKESQTSNIFNRFYRCQSPEFNSMSIDGRGLGLTLCKEIVTAHQGNIYVDAKYGLGSTFSFIIPLYKEV